MLKTLLAVNRWDFSPYSPDQKAAHMHRNMNMIKVATFKPNFKHTFFTTHSWTPGAILNLRSKMFCRTWKPPDVPLSRCNWRLGPLLLVFSTVGCDSVDFFRGFLRSLMSLISHSTLQSLRGRARSHCPYRLCSGADKLVLCEIVSNAPRLFMNSKQSQIGATSNWQFAHVSCDIELKMCRSCDHMCFVHQAFGEMCAVCCAVCTYLIEIDVST